MSRTLPVVLEQVEPDVDQLMPHAQCCALSWLGSEAWCTGATRRGGTLSSPWLLQVWARLKNIERELVPWTRSTGVQRLANRLE